MVSAQMIRVFGESSKDELIFISEGKEQESQARFSGENDELGT